MIRGFVCGIPIELNGETAMPKCEEVAVMTVFVSAVRRKRPGGETTVRRLEQGHGGTRGLPGA